MTRLVAILVLALPSGPPTRSRTPGRPRRHGKILAVGGNDRAVKVWEMSALVTKGR